MQLWLIPILPLAGFALNGLFGKRLPKAAIKAIAVGSVFLAFLLVLKTLSALGVFAGGEALKEVYTEHYATWIQSGNLSVALDLSVDRLTAVMLMIVTGIGTLIHIYATGYMEHEEGYYRFFAYLNLFMFFMLTLVLGGNFLLLFVGWEGVGLCSYLLIGFYFTGNATLSWKTATDAGNKAFIVNRVGDFGFALAMFLIAMNLHSLDFKTVMTAVKGMPVEATAGWITAAALLLLVGACGKSAQIPLYVWLPDAMAGPTPVSALIHAATMVTAGVYMVCRSSEIFLHSAHALDIVAIVGIATAFFAATMGLAQNDIKKVYAYSTVSQLGYMFVGLGTGAFSAGIYHVMTHAFFKALLFLGAGSVIHALHGEQDLRKMGGMKKHIPITFATLTCATFAIAGFPFLSGYYSKDMILEAAYHHAPWMYWVGVVTAGMTAFYCFRAWFLCFFGKERGSGEHGHHHHPHESPAVMWIPLAILAVLSLVGGALIKIPQFLEPMFPLEEVAGYEWLTYVSVAAGFAGIGLAWLFYMASPSIPEGLSKAFPWAYRWILNKYYVDEFYDATVVNPTIGGSRALLWRVADAKLIDGTVNGIGHVAGGVGDILKRAQSGFIRNYAAWVVIGAILAIVLVGMNTGLMGGTR